MKSYENFDIFDIYLSIHPHEVLSVYTYGIITNSTFYIDSATTSKSIL